MGKCKEGKNVYIIYKYNTCVYNGVRLGLILSHKIFSIYMDNHLNILNENGVDCHVDECVLIYYV